VKAYEVHIRWRGYRWDIRGLALNSASLVSGLLEYFGPGALISVKAINL
jgi:hypothetical protein